MPVSESRRFQAWMVPFIALMVAAAGWAVWEGGLLDSIQPYSGRQLQDMPEFSLPDSSGNKHSSDEIQGKVSVIHFWASWCGPCLDEIPKWTAFAGNYVGNEAVRFVAVSLDQKWEDALKVLSDGQTPKGSLSLLKLSIS
jgi:thiol-disulfide isomerase/thioredoxin